MDGDYDGQDTSMYDQYESNSCKNAEVNTYDLDRSNNLSYTKEKDYSSSLEQIHSQRNIFSNDNDGCPGGDSTVQQQTVESQVSLLDESDKNENYDSENSNIQNDEYLLNIDQDNLNKDNRTTDECYSCCTSNDVGLCLEACCTCFCL